MSKTILTILALLIGAFSFSNAQLTLCTPGVCQNGGSCIQLGINLAICACINGYSGVFCNLVPSSTTTTTTTTTTTASINMCNPNTCLNGGTCYQIGRNLGFCGCQNGYSGLFCQISANNPAVSPTSSATENVLVCPTQSTGLCQNGGTCYYSSTTNYITCSCKPQYTGPFCNVLIAG